MTTVLHVCGPCCPRCAPRGGSGPPSSEERDSRGIAEYIAPHLSRACMPVRPRHRRVVLYMQCVLCEHHI